MIEPIDEHFVARVREWGQQTPPVGRPQQPTENLVAYFDAQLQSRHLDFAARDLQRRGAGFYTIGSAGHEANAAVALATRPTDPALLHYRSGAFYAARAAQVAGSTPIQDVLLGMAASVDDPISGGRHKVFGNTLFNIIPQTSTIASHLPRAVGVAFSIDRAARMGVEPAYPTDAIAVCSFGDASANHSTATGALNSAAYCRHRGIGLPILFVCEDNGLGISTKTPPGWMERTLARQPGIEYLCVDPADPVGGLRTAQTAVDLARSERRPVILHVLTVRFMGHAGSDAELSYRTRTEIVRDYERDPLLVTARQLTATGIFTPPEILSRYESTRDKVMAEANRVAQSTERLESVEEVIAPLRRPHHRAARPAAGESNCTGRTLAQSINAALNDVLAAHPEAMVFGEDVAAKGGVYGVTRGLRRSFGAVRVFDTLLDEQTILGTALGAALTGLLPIVEIQYLAYLHNAEDQLRGEAATLRFFSNDQYQNGMIVRIAGLAYQKGFGGHFHNDNSLAVLRDIPGLILAVAGQPADAYQLLHECAALAQDGHVCVLVEPIARYHTRDLHTDGDNGWIAGLSTPSPVELGRSAIYGNGADLLIVTFGNGLFMSLRAARLLAAEGIECTVLDLRWIAPLPEEDLLLHARRFSRILVADETRRSAGVAEGVLAILVDAGRGDVKRVTSVDSFIPLGPAADHVLLSEGQIVDAARAMCVVRPNRTP